MALKHTFGRGTWHLTSNVWHGVMTFKHLYSAFTFGRRYHWHLNMFSKEIWHLNIYVWQGIVKFKHLLFGRDIHFQHLCLAGGHGIQTSAFGIYVWKVMAFKHLHLAGGHGI